MSGHDDYTKEWALERAHAFATDVLASRGDLSLTIFAHLPGGDLLTIPLQHLWGPSGAVRDAAMAAARVEMRRRGALCYIAFAEAWMVETRGPDAARRARALASRPSEHPERIEVVVAVAGDAAGTASRVWKLRRDWKGRFRALEPFDAEGDQPAIIDGRFVDLLVERGALH